MKYLSFNILILSILMPPLLYLATIHGLEKYYLTDRYQTEIENAYLSDMNNILSGDAILHASVRDSIQRFINNDTLIKFGVFLDITISTRDGLVLFPPGYQPGTPVSVVNETPIETARSNFEILQNGLVVEVSASIRLFSIMAMSILLLYIAMSGGGLYLYFNSVLYRARREELEKTRELDRLHQLEEKFNDQFDTLTTERENLVLEYRNLKSSLDEYKQKAARNEEEMFDEIEKLESRLAENLEEQEMQAKEILDLEDKINEFEKLRENINKQRLKNVEKLNKRFKTLYKNIDIHERSMLGIEDLTDDMALKAEELIHQLNADASSVLIKRKVFSRKGKITAFEVVFAYNGRLYFRKNGQQRIEVLAVGTKNTQARDLAYLDRTS